MSVVWTPETYLSWDDFEADSHPGAYQDAQAIIKYGCVWKVRSHGNPLSTHFTINAIQLSTIFIKNLSWVRATAANTTLLKHVQGCFDLAEETRQSVEVELNNQFMDRRYLIRGSDLEEQKQNAMNDSRIVLRSLEDLRVRMLETRIRSYELETQYGKDLQNQAKYNRLFAQLRSK